MKKQNKSNNIFSMIFMGIADFLSFICAKLFFARVVVKNKNKVPTSGPLIFVANHRNMILRCNKHINYIK